MVEINSNHKRERLEAVSGHNHRMVDWFDDEGKPTQVDVTKIDTDELWKLRDQMESYHKEQQKVIMDELNSWTEVHCAVCGMEQVAYRGYPFITWGFRAGYILCPQHLRAYDMLGTPDGERLKQAKAEEAEIKELFG